MKTRQGQLEVNQSEQHGFFHRIVCEDLFSFAFKIWHSNLLVANKIALEALEIITETYDSKPTFYAGKSVKRVVGGLFYLLGLKYKSPKTQGEIARALGTTDLTIRVGYRDWLKHFLSLTRKKNSALNFASKVS